MYYKIISSNIELASKVGDAVGNEQITDMWHHHFSEILNSVHNTDSKSFVCVHIDSVFPKSEPFNYMYVESWACTDSIYENFNYSYFKKTETATPVTKKYRPIAIVTAMSKLFQLCLSKLLDTFLVTSDKPIWV